MIDTSKPIPTSPPNGVILHSASPSPVDHGGVHLRLPRHAVGVRGFPVHGHGGVHRQVPRLGLAFHRSRHRLLPGGPAVQHLPVQRAGQPLASGTAAGVGW